MGEGEGEREREREREREGESEDGKAKSEHKSPDTPKLCTHRKFRLVARSLEIVD